MIPVNYEEEEEDLQADFEMEEDPSLTYAMQVTAGSDKDSTFLGMADGEEAIRQAVLKILNTERYEHEIYSWDYGVELADLIGKPMAYVLSELDRRITDALTADDRIQSVENFTAEVAGKRSVHVSFTVVTANGELDIESEVDV